MLFANVEGIFSSIPPIAVFCGLSFLLAIIIPPDYVVLSYISLEVYTNFGMVSKLDDNCVYLLWIYKYLMTLASKNFCIIKLSFFSMLNNIMHSFIITINSIPIKIVYAAPPLNKDLIKSYCGF